ncbi:flagellar brake protein YcgR [Clostridiales bacterium]|nr:flagellar brake protein YcgR [Clostridiales bacterium]
MGLLDLFKKSSKQEEHQETEKDTMKSEIYSGMRVEVTAFDGRVLFVAKMTSLMENSAELYQYSESEVAPDTEPIRVRIRGYNDHERKAVYMEGTITPKPKHIWQVEDLVVSRIGNDRAFFRLDTNIDATITTFGGFAAGEKTCKLLNISVGGARISSKDRYHEGDKFLLKVKLLEDREISVMYCQILRVIEKGETEFEYGCQFLEMTDAAQERITQNIFAAQRKKRDGIK